MTEPVGSTVAELAERYGIGPEDAYDGPPLPDSHKETPEDAAERIALRHEIRRDRWNSRCPVIYAAVTFTQLDPDQDPDHVSGWWESGHRNLIITGPTGTGKTHAAYAIGHQAVAAGASALAWTMSDLWRALRPDGDPNAYDDAIGCDLLVLDDVGVEKDSDWTTEQLHAILDDRGRNQRRTIVTTNLDGETFLLQYGGRVLDRINDDAVILTMAGPSRRRKAAW